jgi:hypothetical protein
MQSPIVHEAIQTEDRTRAATAQPAMATHEMHKIKIDKHDLTADLDRAYPDLMLILLGRMGAVQIVYCAAICCIYLHTIKAAVAYFAWSVISSLCTHSALQLQRNGVATRRVLAVAHSIHQA